MAVVSEKRRCVGPVGPEVDLSENWCHLQCSFTFSTLGKLSLPLKMLYLLILQVLLQLNHFNTRASVLVICSRCASAFAAFLSALHLFL
jgi:hypothetical protein